MMPLLRPGFDRNVLAAPFGVLFRDRIDQRVVAEGLAVSLRDPRQPDSRVRLLAPNRQGVFVAHAVPGLRPGGDGLAPDSPLQTRLMELTVSDSWGRYVPLRMSAELPYEGLFEPACMADSPGTALPHVPLYSAAARQASTAWGMLRADMRLASDPAEGAAWARLELWLDAGMIGEGVADRRGSVLLLCALPALRDPPLRASPSAGPEARSSWEVTLRAFWTPGLAEADIPDLCELRRAPEVPLLQNVASAMPLGPCVLQAGVPSVVRSTGSSFVFVGA
jgi:hypothetical protein